MYILVKGFEDEWEYFYNVELKAKLAQIKYPNERDQGVDVNGILHRLLIIPI